MKYQLLLFYGSSPGAGKSALSSKLNEQLRRGAVPVEWIYEDDVLVRDCFTPVVECVQGRSELDLIEACSVATEGLMEAYSNSETMIVTDSILPYYDWLLAADYSEDVIAGFSSRLWQKLRPLNPLIIYLNANVEIALKRAVAYRGEAWLERSIAFMNSWGANQAQPLQDLADVIGYDQRTDRAKQRLLSKWVGDVLWLDTIEMPMDECMTKVLSALELEPHIFASDRTEERGQSVNFDDYVGQYHSCNDALRHAVQTISVSIKNDGLWVDLYWPNGCRLVSEGEGVFRLQNTSHWLAFEKLGHEHRMQIRYHCRGEVIIYQ